MDERRSNADEIARVIADRSTGASVTHPGTPLRRYVHAAVDLLRNGNRASAAALFEITLNFEPTNAEAHNNLAFCIMPDRPADALTHLDRAASLGSGVNPAMVMANRIYALGRLGRYTSALALVEEFFRRFGHSEAHPGWMWSFEQEPKLLDIDDLASYTRDLAIAITEATGDATLITTWAAKLSPEAD